MEPEIYSIIGKNERILWKGKPDRKCFLLESMFNPMLPFAAIWGLIDGFIITGFLTGKPNSEPAFLGVFLFLFFLLHLMPVWIYLGGVVFSALTHKNTYYVITNKALYASGGTFSVTYTRTPLTQIYSVSISRGIIDNFLNVGDVLLNGAKKETTSPRENTNSGRTLSTNPNKDSVTSLCDLADYQEVFHLLKMLSAPDASAEEPLMPF